MRLPCRHVNGSVTVRDAFFDVSGGRVTTAGRLTHGKNQKWKVTVEPTSTADIVITTRGTESCDAAHEPRGGR